MLNRLPPAYASTSALLKQHRQRLHTVECRKVTDYLGRLDIARFQLRLLIGTKNAAQASFDFV